MKNMKRMHTGEVSITMPGMYWQIVRINLSASIAANNKYIEEHPNEHHESIRDFNQELMHINNIIGKELYYED